MNVIHRTREGTRMLVSQMTDDHLVNTITLICNQITEARAQLDANIGITAFKAAIYRINPKTISEQAKQALPGLIRSLYPYVTEATLRGLSITPLLQQTFDRKTAEDTFSICMPAPQPKRPTRLAVLAGALEPADFCDEEENDDGIPD